MSKDGTVVDRECVTQLDTASPICLVKSNIVPLDLISKSSDDGYEGINGSTLEVLGRVEAEIAIENLSADKVIFRVVSDHAMKCDTILGRDAIKLLDLTLVKREEEKREEAIVSEIVNIESRIADGDEMDDININTEVSSETRKEFVSRFRKAYFTSRKTNRAKY